MLDETAKGVFTIAATPFLPDGALDFQSFDRLVDAYVEKGADGLTILGMMGEAGKLTAAESMAVVRRVVGRTSVPVIVGVSSHGFAAMTELAAGAMQAGVAGVMVAPPPALRTDAQIASYYHDAVRALGQTPFVLQDFPLVTGVQIATPVILKIVEDCPTCVMLKHEDWPGLQKISALRAASHGGRRRISILCGNGGLFLLEEMLRGADGAMTGFGYPGMMARVVAAFRTGDIDRARDIFDPYMPMIRCETQPNLGLAIRKYSLARQGILAHPTLRRPGAVLSAAAMAEIDALAVRQATRLATLGF